MNRTVKTTVLVTAALMIIGGCGTEKTATKDNSAAQAKVEESSPIVETAKAEEPTAEASEKVVEQEPDNNVSEIKKGDTVTVDGYADVSVIKHKFSQKIEPSKPGSFYTYYESKEEDSTYFAIIIKAKNLHTSGVVADEIANVSLLFDNQYDYPTFSVVEENGGKDFTYSNITSVNPLKTTTLYYLVEIPNEVAKSDKPLKATINVKDKVFEYTVR